MELEQGQQNGSIPNFTISDVLSFNVTGEIDPIVSYMEESLQAAVNSVDSLREQGTQLSSI